MTKKYHAEMTKVRSARIKLLSKWPFWGDLAFGLPIKWDDTLNPPTAATNGEYIAFHPEFVASLPIDELVFVLAHEVMHPALMHILRRGTRCPKRWNIACDIVVNYLLNSNNVGTMPSFAVSDYNLYNKGEGKVEKIYELLPKDKEYGEPGSGWNGTAPVGSMDAMGDATPGNEDNLAANWRNKLQQALQTAKRAGALTRGLEEFVEQMTTPQVPWQQHLRNFVMTTRGGERTYARRNRRYASTDIILPGTYGEKMGNIGFAIDCSGSTSNQMVADAGGEVGSIQEELRPEKVHVFYFDTDVNKHEEFEADDPVTVKAYGRGGTCFRTVFEYIQQNNIDLESCIVATDLECNDYGPEPPFPVLWLAEDTPYTKQLAKAVPWGQVLFTKPGE